MLISFQTALSINGGIGFMYDDNGEIMHSRSRLRSIEETCFHMSKDELVEAPVYLPSLRVMFLP